MSTILLVEDDTDLRRLLTKVLERENYRVLEAGTGLEAMQILDLQTPDLVITDIVMPNMSGDKLADKIIGIRSDIPIVLCTGYSEKFTRQHATDMGIQAFLMKPLVMQDLANTVRQALSVN